MELLFQRQFQGEPDTYAVVMAKIVLMSMAVRKLSLIRNRCNVRQRLDGRIEIKRLIVE